MSEQEFYHTSDDWAKDLQAKYEEYLWACESMIDGEEPDDFQTLSGEPFDGCGDCYTREQLFFLIPQIIKAYKDGTIVWTADKAE